MCKFTTVQLVAKYIVGAKIGSAKLMDIIIVKR
jgi:hypothetical protein